MLQKISYSFAAYLFLCFCTRVWAEPVNFDKEIRPLLKEKCHSCHGPQKHEGGLRLDSKNWTLKGGDSGSALVSKNLEKSALYQRIISTDDDLRMPAKAPALSKEQQDLFKRWIAEGANWTENADDKLADRDPRLDHWSFQPISKPVPPVVKSKNEVSNPIDQFIISKSEAGGIPRSPAADRRTLIRRAYIDLIGLTPTYEEVQAFVNDPAVDAYDQLIDQLLASPHYGERYGRHWLDIARYADTMGYNFTNDNRHYFAWTFRDYVVNAINEDLPYDKFVKDQLAADRAHPDQQDKTSLAALGFLTVGGNFVGDPHGRTDDQIDVITRGLLGLTMQCARCHAHKYDPLSMGDYYALYGIMKSSHEPIDAGRIAETITSLPVIAPPKGTPDQIADYENKVREEQEKLRKWDIETREKVFKEIEERGKSYIGKVKDQQIDQKFLRPRVLKLYEQVINDNQTFKNKPFAEINDDEIKSITEMVKSKITIEELDKYLINEEENRRRQKEKVLGNLHGTHPGAPTRAMALYDNDKPYNPVIFLRGSDRNRGDKVPRRFIEIFNDTLGLKPFNEGSGRLELAEAITNPKNPLTARVIVNRLWMWHYGQALVRTPGDFGLRGELPTHPELLDFLASYLIEHDWSIKAVQRLIMTSATYQLSSQPVSNANSQDPENRLWTHQNVRRLEMEPLRDTLIEHTIGLNDSLGGQPVELFDAPYTNKRTIYGFVDRYKIDPEFKTFDFATVETSCPQRPYTTVPQQSLFMMNHEMISQFAAELAKKIEQLPVDPKSNLKPDVQKITALFQELYQRDPEQAEVDSLMKFINKEKGEALLKGEKQQVNAWAKLSQALLMSNEFLFID